MDEAAWLDAIREDPHRHALPAYGPWMTPERAAALWASWEADESAGVALWWHKRELSARCTACPFTMRTLDC